MKFYRPLRYSLPADDRMRGRLVAAGRSLVVGLVLLAPLAVTGFSVTTMIVTAERLETEKRAAELRAERAEEALQMMRANGDRGILLAHINTADMGRVELRLVPVGRKQ